MEEIDREMIRSILQKDNERLEKEIDGTSAESVFAMNWEGGGTEITRYTAKDGKQYFRRSGGGMDFDDNDDEVWNHYEDSPASSFEEVLFFLGFGKTILCLRPSVIHPDYRERMREYIEKLLSEVTAEDRASFGDRMPKSANEWLSRIK